METLQSTIFIEFDVNTKKITFLRGDGIIDYDSNITNIYVRVKYKNLSGNTVYLTPSELKDYKFSLYTIKPTTNNVNLITGKVTDELKENVYGGVVKFEIPRACTNRLGIVKCEIHINQRNKMLASSIFVLDVRQSLVTEFDDELLGDEDFPVLKQLILEIQKDSNIDDYHRSKITTYSSDKIEDIKENLSSLIEDIQNKIIFVDDLGAVGDGVNDDTEAIQKALDAQGIVILSQNKTYRITHTILLKDDTLFLGQNSTIYYDANTSSVISVYKYKGNTSTTKNITLRDFNLKQRPYNDKTKCDVNAVWLPFCENVLIENVSSENIRWHLLDIASSKNVIVRNCRAKNHDSAAIQIDGTLLQSGTVLLKDGSQDTNSFVKMGCDNVIVESCDSINCETGIHMHRDGGKNIKIINNTIIGCSYSGILSDEKQEWNDLIIENNYLKNCCEGIHLRGYGRNYNISNNNIIGNNRDTDMGLRLGFALNGDDNFYGDVIISGNLISNYFRAGYIQQAENININNNIFKECGYTIDTITNENNKNDISRYAINLDNVKNSTIANNSFVENYFCDIQLKKIFNIDIINNKSNSNGNFINGSSTTELKEELRIINNSITNNNAFNSINLNTIENVDIDENKIKQTSNTCILTTNMKNGKIVNNNLISENGTFGIRLYNSDSYFNENRITGFTTPYSFEGGTGACNVSGILFDTPSRAGTVNGVITYYASSTPTHDSFDAGSKIINTSPVDGGCMGWIKTGSFTWKKFITIES